MRVTPRAVDWIDRQKQRVIRLWSQQLHLLLDLVR